MAAREYVWTDVGRAKAGSNGVSFEEVSDALHAPKGLYYERRLGGLLLIVMGDGGDRPGHRGCLRPDRGHADLQDRRRTSAPRCGPGPVEGEHLMSAPDFEAMSVPEDFERYFASTTDHTDFIRWMQRTGRQAPPDEVAVEAPDSVPMEITAVRLSKTTLQRLDRLADNDKAGRSGLIRLAIDEFLAKIDRDAA
jgi:hypothetical protein